MADRDVDIVCSTRVKKIAKWYKVCLNTFFSGLDRAIAARSVLILCREGLTRDIECDPVLETNSRNTHIASARPIHSYEKRPRRKTKADRYEPYKGTSVSEQGSPRPKHFQKRAILMKRNNSRVAEKFRAKNIKTGRLTVRRFPEDDNGKKS
jgi:hypothetical protein